MAIIKFNVPDAFLRGVKEFCEGIAGSISLYTEGNTVGTNSKVRAEAERKAEVAEEVGKPSLGEKITGTCFVGWVDKVKLADSIGGIIDKYFDTEQNLVLLNRGLVRLKVEDFFCCVWKVLMDMEMMPHGACRKDFVYFARDYIHADVDYHKFSTHLKAMTKDIESGKNSWKHRLQAVETELRKSPYIDQVMIMQLTA